MQVKHNPRHRRSRPLAIAAAGIILTSMALPSIAQDDEIAPERPNGRPQDEPRDPITNRRIHDGEPIYLSFNNVAIKDTLDFIIETTGKTVIPDMNALNGKITIISDVPMSRDEALNKLFMSFLSAQVPAGVVEYPDIIRIEVLDTIASRDLPVIGPDQSLMDRPDDGVIVNKVFNLRYRDAEAIADVLIEMVPTWGRVEVEAGSNSIVTVVNIGTGKKLEEIITAIDRPGNYETRTFVLDHSDAATIADYILTLYSEAESGGGGGGGGGRDPRFDPRDPRNQGRDEGRGGGSSAAAGGGTELRVVPNSRSNTVTVQADPAILEMIASQIEVWDSPQQEGEIMKVYHLKYMDAVVVRNLLNELLAGGGGSLTGGQMRVANAQGVPMAAGGSSSGDGATRVQGLFQIEADGGANRLIVFALTPASFDYFDDIIEKLDQPGARNKPALIELKHADAQELAQVLNILFAPSGTNMEFQGQEEGLSEFEVADDFGTDAATGGSTGLEGQGQEAEALDFWWLAARPREDEMGTQSELVERVRVMPIFRQNALMVVGPPYYQDLMAELIAQLDRPGRQVLITAIIAEVELEDLISLGVRWGSGNITGVPTDNTIITSGEFDGVIENDILTNLFDTSVLNVGVDVNAVIQLLQSESNLRVLSQPRIFTSDNEQANFFDGQNIQFVQESISDIQTGNLNQSFEFRRVGITLSVRPRITVNRDVDLLVNLELSSLAPGQTQSGGLIIDQRVTTTRAILKDGQTIVISGILREEESDVIRKVPLLGDLPWVGALFSSIDTDQRRSEIIAFVTPIVVDNPDENESLNVPFRDRLQELQRPLDEQVKDPAGAERIWDVDPDAHPHREEAEGDMEVEGETLEEAVEEDLGRDDDDASATGSADDGSDDATEDAGGGSQ
jgi:type II secretion system protein D